ncbi:MAG TPA: PIN domain-containing protein [Candidatus Methylomirabilis sp.]|nr:PIN domain-containing protein [Candidatus Methylomirabilis sp.]
MLDTSAYSAFMRGHPEVKRALQQWEEIWVSPVVLGELLAGFVRGKRRGERAGTPNISRFTTGQRGCRGQ